MNNWRPINTAPKDRWVLLFKPNIGYLSGYWDDNRKFWTDGSSNMSDPIAWQELPVFDGVISE